MLDIKFIRENKDLVKKNSLNRGAVCDIDALLDLDLKRRDWNEKIESLRAERNEASKTRPTPEIIGKMKKIGEEIKELEEKYDKTEEGFKELLYSVPNLTHAAVKVSKNDEDNVILEAVPKIKQPDFTPLDHVSLSENLDLIDFERGAKVAGNKFYYLKNELSRLELALSLYAFDVIEKHGFTPITSPDLAKREILDKMGYNPRGESTQVYNIDDSDLSLIGTSEITMGGYHQDEVLSLDKLPEKYVALSHCFRTEAGSYSKYSKGIFRVHQFTKIEMFIYSTPEEAEAMHSEMLEIEKEIFTGLGIPFRVIDHCTADLGTPSFRTFDLEAWMPGKPNREGKLGDWAEITSTSNCTDFQSRALNIKYIDKNGERKLVYTINGTGIAIPRAMIAILENFQTSDGSIKVPHVLHKYLPFQNIQKK